MAKRTDREVDVPPFADLYEDHARAGYLTRLAYCLWTVLQVLGDEFRMAVDEPNDELLDDLPPVARNYASSVWLARFAQCFDDLAARLASGDVS